MTRPYTNQEIIKIVCTMMLQNYDDKEILDRLYESIPRIQVLKAMEEYNRLSN